MSTSKKQSHVSTKSHSNVSSSHHPNPSSVEEVIQQLDAIEAALDLDIVVPPNDKDQIRVLKRVSPEALTLAAEVVAIAPEKFPDFADLSSAAAYVATMTPLAARALDLATHVQKSIDKKRAPAASQAFALYAMVKGLGRLADNETMREKVQALKAALVPAPKNPKPKVTKQQKAVRAAEKARADRVKKAMEVLAANGAVPPAPSPEPAPAPIAAPPAVNGVGSHAAN